MTLLTSSIIQQLQEYAPIHLSDLIHLIGDAGMISWLADMAYEYVPHHAQHILDQPSLSAAVSQFVLAFSSNVFPLDHDYIEFRLEGMEVSEDEDPDYPNSPISMLAEAIPIRLYGVDIEDPHLLWDNNDTPTALLVTLQSMSVIYMDPTPNLRPSWVDEASHHVSENVLRMMPPGGFDTDQLLHAAQTCPDPEAAAALMWSISATGNTLLDESYNPEAYPFYRDEWSKENIDSCRQLWQETEPILQRIRNFLQRLENDPNLEFAALISHINSAATPTPDDPQPEAEP